MNLPPIHPRLAVRFSFFLVFSLILFLPPPVLAQIDTSKVGWRDRANVWTEENRFEAPLWFFPASGIPADNHVMPFRARLNGSTNALWGISLMHTQFSNGTQTHPTYTNQTMGFGYNLNREDLGEPSIGLHFESQFYQGAWLTEFHLNSTGIDGTPHRWLYSLGDRQTGHNRLMSWESEYFVLNGPKQPGPWLALDADNDTSGTYVGGSLKLLGNSSLQHNQNNYPILYGKGTQSFMQLLMLNSSDALVLGSIGATNDYWRPKAIDLQARSARFVMDGMTQKYSLGCAPIATDSTLQVDGGARFNGGIRLRSSFGADSLSATTKGYVDTRFAAAAAGSEQIISDSIAQLEARTLVALRDTLDTNSRQYTRLSQLSDSLNTLPRQQGMTAAALRDSLDANTRQYTRISQLSDSLNTLPRQQGISVAQLSDSLNSLPRQQGMTAAALRDSLDANTRQYTRISQLSDSLNTIPRQQGISVAQLSDSLNTLPRQQGMTATALRDSLDANTRQYTRLAQLSDSLNTIPRQQGMTAAALRDSLDANTRQYTRLSQLSDSLNTIPRQQGMTAAALRDSLDANTRQYTRLAQLSDSLNTIPRQQGISAAQLSDSLNTLPRQQGMTATALRDSLDANTRQYTRLSQLSDSLNTLPRQQGMTATALRDSLDANTRQYTPRAELADSLDRIPRQAVTLEALSDSLDANERLTIRPTHGLMSTSIDWTDAEVFADTVSSNTTYTFPSTLDGKTIVVAITSTGNYAITWPSAVRWPYMRAPVQTANKTDIYTFIRIGSSIYGTYVQNY
ncbi:MAG: hypothetical protein HY962_17010 [Ignavibacteriae bacterium]|nr:hypothetical protein [Ignavibacteriota bacterium]